MKVGDFVEYRYATYTRGIVIEVMTDTGYADVFWLDNKKISTVHWFKLMILSEAA